MARIYIETTIASFYYEVRTEPEMVARRNWTRRWFDAAAAGSDELVTSLALEAELEAGDFPGKVDALALVADLPLVDLNESVAEAVDAYISYMVMPNDPTVVVLTSMVPKSSRSMGASYFRRTVC